MYSYKFKMKVFPLRYGYSNLSILCTNESIEFILNYKNENSNFLKFEKSYKFYDLINISKWFKIFDSLDEVFEDITKLLENGGINVNLEDNTAKLVFNVNMLTIKKFDIILDKKELSNDELINNLIKENKELKIRIYHLEDKFKAFIIIIAFIVLFKLSYYFLIIIVLFFFFLIILNYSKNNLTFFKTIYLI